VELDARGNLLNSSAEIPRLEALDWRFASRQMEWLCRARWIVVETGLDETLLGKAMDWAARRGTPVCGLPTRLRQTGPRWHILRRTSCLILNHQEAAQILEMPVRTATDANLAVRRLLSQGISSVAITMGAQGVVTAQRGGAVSTYRAPAARVVDSTGAGDAFAAALIASLVTGRSFARGIVAGLELARQTVESRETVVASPAVSTWRMPNDERHP
jgi:sugar/nucleoside kinase (ribokinase family)